MNILVTGASGYIGYHLIQKLVLNDNDIIYGLSRNAVKIKAPNFKHLNIDLLQQDFVNLLPQNIDLVFHLAQSNEYRNFPEKAVDIFSINVYSTQLLAEWCRKNYVKKFFFTSSGNVYKQQAKLLNEKDTCDPDGFYGSCKYASEILLKPYSEFFQVSILRIFGVYGPEQQKMVIPNIIERVKSESEITMAQNAGLYFTPLFIDDCVEMIMGLEKTIKDKFSVFNLSGDIRTSIKEIAEITGEILHIKPNLKTTQNSIVYLMGDNEKVKKQIGYSSFISLRYGMEKMLKPVI